MNYKKLWLSFNLINGEKIHLKSSNRRQFLKILSLKFSLFLMHHEVQYQIAINKVPKEKTFFFNF